MSLSRYSALPAAEKPTMLNIIGGLDRYDSGDLSINNKSTKKFKDSDWDSYRNHSIGFVFQNYNLIPHQTVLSNVELALTLSGVSKSERRKRAKEVLEKVGLGDQLRKKPNQMSGGQMQRVAIARALVNNPEILLADEPTGALDSGTSVQIMELLKEIAKEKLVIMVTHNPDLAEQYSSRIVKLLDGRITDDSNPYNPGEFTATTTDAGEKGKKKKEKKQKTSMSILTAFSLSLNNLMTKKGRTILTAFAGSIGIIGIALILSLSNGFQLYIDKVQEDTLSSYPLTIQKESVDLGTMIATLQEERSSETNHDKDKVYSSTVMADLMNTMITEARTNNLAEFKKFIERDENGKKICRPITRIVGFQHNSLTRISHGCHGIAQPVIRNSAEIKPLRTPHRDPIEHRERVGKLSSLYVCTGIGQPVFILTRIRLPVPVAMCAICIISVILIISVESSRRVSALDRLVSGVDLAHLFLG